MKRIIVSIIVIVLALFAVTSCNGSTPEDPNPEYNAYEIKWVDEKGVTLATQTVKEGKVPYYSYNVVDTAEWDYTFNGWSLTAGGEALSAIPAVESDATYYALVSATKQRYTVSFNTLGGSEVASQTVEYGSKATLPTAPTYAGHRFVGWSTSQSEVAEVDFDAQIKGNVEYFAVWNTVVDVKGLLSSLIGGYKLNPYSYIPNTMKADYSGNLVDSADIVTDYTDFVNISDITYGFGEQWHMVAENLSESMIFFNVLNTIDTISTASVSAFNNYFDQNPADTANYSHKNGIYNVSIKFDGEIISYVVDYTATLPVLGETDIQIALAMVVETGEKNVRIQLGDSNALRYVVRENSYEFAIKYLGVRTAMFSVERKNDGSVKGKIYEYLSVQGYDLVSSAAEFYITQNYVSVVGNKADGMIGFTGTICELYNASTGKMIGYEVNESTEISAVSVNFDTLWFNLNAVSGINSVKFVTSTEDNKVNVYVNGLSKVWESKKVGGLSLTTLSRRFDIELRTQYVTSYDSSTQKYTTHKIQVPMLFVQEGNYETLSSDVKAVNDINISVNVSSAGLNKLLNDYDELIPTFNENKEAFTKAVIETYIGQKYSTQ